MSADTDCSCQKVVLYSAAGSVVAVWPVAPGCRHCRHSNDPRSRNGFARSDIVYVEIVHHASPTSTSTAWHAIHFAPAAPVGWTVEADRRSRAKAAGYAMDLARVAAGEDFVAMLAPQALDTALKELARDTALAAIADVLDAVHDGCRDFLSGVAYVVLRIIGLPPSVAQPLGAVVGQLAARAYLAPIRSLSRGLRIISIADNVLETAAPARSLEHQPQPQPRPPKIAEPPNPAAPAPLPPPTPPPVSAPAAAPCPEPAPVPATEVPPPPSPPAASSPQPKGSVAPEPPANPTLRQPIEQPNAATAELQPAASRDSRRPVEPPGPAEPPIPGEPPVLIEAPRPDEAPVVRQRLPELQRTGPQPPNPIEQEAAGHPTDPPIEDAELPTAGEHWTVTMQLHDHRPDRAASEGPATDPVEPEPVADVPVMEPKSPDGPATVDGVVAQRPMPAPGEDDGPYPSFW